jgi:hypothetical protein
MNLWISAIFYLLLKSVMPEFVHYLVVYNFSLSTTEELESVTNSSAVYIYIYIYIYIWYFAHSIAERNLSFTYSKFCGNLQRNYQSQNSLSSFLVIYSAAQVSDVIVLTVCSKFITFVFQLFPLFLPEISAGFTYYIIQIIPIYFTWIL